MKSSPRRGKTSIKTIGIILSAASRPRRPCGAIAWRSTPSRSGRGCCAMSARSMPRPNCSDASCGCPSFYARSALESFHPGGAAPVVQAAGEFGVAHMLSSVCDPGLEEVAKAAPDALRMFQLYVRGDAAWVDDYVARAVANGYSVFCLTVDTAHYSRRERDIA